MKGVRMVGKEPVCFDPETISALKEILDEAWNRLPAERQATMLKTTLAERLLKTAAEGERNRDRLLDVVLRELAAWSLSATSFLPHNTPYRPYDLLASGHKQRRNFVTYVDGFVAAVPTTNREIYKKHAEAAAVVFKEHGALKFVECWGDDVPDGKLTSFPMAVKRKDDETVVFSWIVWPSRDLRNEGMKKVMADPRMQPDVNPMPFDGKRMIYGGFEMIVEAWWCGTRLQ